jgi:tripartite-type tricarboxylate transporter receptor subunit TctC
MLKPSLVRLATSALLALYVAAPATAAAADDFPSRAVHLVVTFPPGGASDLMARILAQKLSQDWNQAVIVDNKPGANGSLGTDYAARQPADGYTFMMGNMGPTLVNPLLSKVPYDLNRDFIPVSLVATGPCVLVVNSKSPYKTLKDLVAAAKAKPGSLNFGSGGTGTLAQLGGEMLNQAAGIKMQHVPYKGGVAAVNDLLAGQIDLVVADTQAVMQYIKADKLRPLAITSSKRTPQLPDVPTFAESGMGDLVALNSWGVYLPAKTPPEVVAKYRTAVDKVMQDPSLVKLYYDLGVDALHSSAAELKAFNDNEIVKYAKIIKEKNIHVD